MPEWLIERGIGETRAALVEDGEIVEARILLDGIVRSGTTLAARLINVGAGGRNALAADGNGAEYLLPRGASGVTQGAAITIEVTREAIPGIEPWKRPIARLSDEPAADAPAPDDREVTFPSPDDELGVAGWNELVDEARSGVVRFDGGELRIFPTPAMTLIDVDGGLPSGELAVRGAREAAAAIRRLDIGGSIGIDLPTAGSKTVRHEAAQAIDSVLAKPFERTAVNGFGFVQVVRPRFRASLVELAQDRASFEARALLRRVSYEKGAVRLAVHPAVAAALRRDWIDVLSRQVGGPVTLRPDPAQTISGGYAEAS